MHRRNETTGAYVRGEILTVHSIIAGLASLFAEGWPGDGDIVWPSQVKEGLMGGGLDVTYNVIALAIDGFLDVPRQTRWASEYRTADLRAAVETYMASDHPVWGSPH